MLFKSFAPKPSHFRLVCKFGVFLSQKSRNLTVTFFSRINGKQQQNNWK